MAYLEAIGIDLWVSRRDSGASAAAGRVPSAAASERDVESVRSVSRIACGSRRQAARRPFHSQ